MSYFPGIDEYLKQNYAPVSETNPETGLPYSPLELEQLQKEREQSVAESLDYISNLEGSLDPKTLETIKNEALLRSNPNYHINNLDPSTLKEGSPPTNYPPLHPDNPDPTNPPTTEEETTVNQLLDLLSQSIGSADTSSISPEDIRTQPSLNESQLLAIEHDCKILWNIAKLPIPQQIRILDGIINRLKNINQGVQNNAYKRIQGPRRKNQVRQFRKSRKYQQSQNSWQN